MHEARAQAWACGMPAVAATCVAGVGGCCSRRAMSIQGRRDPAPIASPVTPPAARGGWVCCAGDWLRLLYAGRPTLCLFFWHEASTRRSVSGPHCRWPAPLKAAPMLSALLQPPPTGVGWPPSTVGHLTTARLVFSSAEQTPKSCLIIAVKDPPGGCCAHCSQVFVCRLTCERVPPGGNLHACIPQFAESPFTGISGNIKKMLHAATTPPPDLHVGGERGLFDLSHRHGSDVPNFL